MKKNRLIIAILAISLLVSLYYNYELSSKVNVSDKKVETLVSEKDTMLKQLEALKATYDLALEEKTSISEELEKERNKVIKLIADLKKTNGSLANFKEQIKTLQRENQFLIAQNDELKNQNKILVSQRDSTEVVLEQTLKENTYLAKTIDKGSKLTLLNLQAEVYKLKSSGKKIVTDKASKANFLKISFVIAENQIAGSGDKNYYVQIIDSKNNVLGDSSTIEFDEKELTYSFIATVKYENQTVLVSQDLPGTHFEKGVYTVNVFDKDQLVLSNSFTLR